MTTLLVLGFSVFVYFVLTNALDGLAIEQPKEMTRLPQMETAVMMPQNPPRRFDKIVEATENSTEYPDGTVVTTRNVRQWN